MIILTTRGVSFWLLSTRLDQTEKGIRPHKHPKSFGIIEVAEWKFRGISVFSNVTFVIEGISGRQHRLFGGFRWSKMNISSIINACKLPTFRIVAEKCALSSTLSAVLFSSVCDWNFVDIEYIIAIDEEINIPFFIFRPRHYYVMFTILY